jgi:hypothetical protein
MAKSKCRYEPVLWCAASISYASYGAQRNNRCSIADELPNGYQSALVVVIVVVVMPNDYHTVVVAAVAVMPIWLRKSAGGEEHKQDKY